MRKVGPQLRLFYAAAPGDVIGTFKHWRDGHEDPTIVSVAYSAQFYSVCQDLNARAYVISSHSRKAVLRDRQFRIEHRPNRLRRASGALYHFGQLCNGLRLMVSALCFRADFAIVAEGTHWFVLALLKLGGVKVIPALHCRLWPLRNRPRRVKSVIRKLNRRFFAKHCHAIMSISHAVSEQVIELTGGDHPPIVEFTPLFSSKNFAGIRPPNPSERPFRVLYAGRIEYDKGVFDLLAIARRFTVDAPGGFEFDICGEGSALDTLRREVAQNGLSSSYRCHGHCNAQRMREMFERAHAVIVPTQTGFVEGFNKVVVESVMAGRPVVTSTVCPSLHDVAPAAVTVPPDDVRAYGDALLRLRDDTEYYDQKRRACASVRDRFFDETQSWGAALKKIITDTRNDCDSRNASNRVLRREAASRSPFAAATEKGPASLNPKSAQQNRKSRH